MHCIHYHIHPNPNVAASSKSVHFFRISLTLHTQTHRSPRSPSRTMSDAQPSTSTTPPDASWLHAIVGELSSVNPASRARAAETLLELEFGEEGHGASWALALCAAGAVVPLLRMAQGVVRDPTTLAPVEEEKQAEAIECADAALLTLSELGAVATGLLEDEGYQLELDESNGQPLFVDSKSGMASAAPPKLRVAEEASEEEAWVFSLLVETLTLVTPLGINPNTGKIRWSVEVVEHVPARESSSGRVVPEVSVLDMVVEDGDLGDATRVLVVGPWRGSEGAVEAEKDPSEPLGVALDSWRDATYVTSAMMTPVDEIERVLICGCAGGAVAAFLQRYHPSVAIDVVEPDEAMVAMSTEHFELSCETCGDDVAIGDVGRPGTIRVFCESLSSFTARATADSYDVIIGSWPTLEDPQTVADGLNKVAGKSAVVALSSMRAETIELSLGGDDDSRARLLRDPADVTFEDVDDERPGKRSRDDIASAVRPRDVVCRFVSDPPTDAFVPEAWTERLTKKLGSALVDRFPYALAAVDSRGAFSVLDYAAVEDATGPHVQAPDVSNTAWDAFGATESVADVFDRSYWNAILGAHGCAVDGGRPEPSSDDIDVTASTALKSTLRDDGYVWGDVIVPPEETTALRRGIEALSDAKWPPACVFVSDIAWRVIDRLFAHAEALLGAECVLEPSVAAFKLEKDAANGKRYIGNNFGVPHRDYSLEDAIDAVDGSPQILSLWLPLNRVTEQNGCMYIVGKRDDPDGGKGDVSTKSAPDVPRGSAKALAPVDPGTLLAWSGNALHWGSACASDSDASPRVSVAFVFRRRGDAEKRADSRCAPLTRTRARETTLETRLAVIHHAIGVFEHWYGDADDVKNRLMRPPNA